MCFSFWTVTICNFQSPKLQYRFIRKHLHLRIYYAALSHRLYQLLYNMVFFCVLCSRVQAHWGVQLRRLRAIFFLSRQPYSCFSLLLYFVHFTFTPPAPNMIYQGLNGRVVGNIPHPFSVRLLLPTNEWSNLMWSALPAFDPPPPPLPHLFPHNLGCREFSSFLFRAFRVFCCSESREQKARVSTSEMYSQASQNLCPSALFPSAFRLFYVRGPESLPRCYHY